MNARDWTAHFKKLAKLGYMARGSVYLVVGALALLSAFGKGGDETNSKGALLTILEQPFGRILLVVLIIGLLGYSLWRATQSIKDVDHHGRSAKGMAVRVGLFASAVAHAALAVWATKLMIGMGSGGGSGAAQSWLNGEFGQILLAATGMVLAAVGIATAYKGWAASFDKYMNIPRDQERWAKPVAQFGLIARGVVWGILSWFFIRSALLAGSGEIHGMEDALHWVHQQPYGGWLLAVTAAGLFSYGIYSILEALYRRINAPSLADLKPK